MEIGINSGSFDYLKTPEELFARMKELGYTHVDWDLGNIQADFYQDTRLLEQYCAAIRQAASNAGINIHQVHGPWPTDDTTPESRKKVWDYMHKAVYGCHLLGSSYLVIHPQMPFGWGTEEDADYAEELTIQLMTELMKDCQTYQVTLCLENMPMKAHRISPVKNIAETVAETHRRLTGTQSIPLGICLDTGHCNVYGHDLGEAVRCAAPFLKVLHIHDNGGDRDSHLLPFAGTADWNSFTSALAEINYSGPLMLETAGFIPGNATASIRRKAEELTAFAARELADMIKASRNR